MHAAEEQMGTSHVTLHTSHATRHTSHISDITNLHKNRIRVVSEQFVALGRQRRHLFQQNHLIPKTCMKYRGEHTSDACSFPAKNFLVPSVRVGGGGQ